MYTNNNNKISMPYSNGKRFFSLGSPKPTNVCFKLPLKWQKKMSLATPKEIGMDAAVLPNLDVIFTFNKRAKKDYGGFSLVNWFNG